MDIEKMKSYAEKSFYAALDEHPNTCFEKCQEGACKYPEFAYYFAEDIPGADIEYCQKACQNVGKNINKDIPPDREIVQDYTDCFIINIPEANVELGYEHCRKNNKYDMFDMDEIEQFILNDI